MLFLKCLKKVLVDLQTMTGSRTLFILLQDSRFDRTNLAPLKQSLQIQNLKVAGFECQRAVMVVNGEWLKKGQPFLQMLSTAVVPVCVVKYLSYGC